jgi:AraC-like DNA-binding protein/mannose-6-phosphate isomerase-like protein (cupin superfamily)
MNRQRTSTTLRTWSYGRCRDDSAIEQAIWFGSFSLGLSCHFHNEIQITTVLSGRRSFLTAGGHLNVVAGETLIVPPGLPHQALGIEAVRTLSINLYAVPSDIALFDRDPIIVQRPRWLQAADGIGTASLRDWAIGALMRSGRRKPEQSAHAVASVPIGDHLSIAELASGRGMSREGFIRWFHRNVGMPPHAYRLAHRLTRARALLAANIPAAEAAVEAGFSDQSHMGRNFRRAFGVTPDAYRRALQI